MGDKHFGFELPQLLVIAWLVVLYTLLTPLLIFSVHRYRQRLHHPFIYCRRPKLVITCCILTILYSSIYSPILLILTHFSSIWTAYNNLTLETHFLLNILPLLLISLHFSIRFYQVYYDLNYNSSIADQIWSQAINTHTKNFYINNREKYGKPRFQYIIFTIFMSILNTIIITIVLIFGSTTIYIAQILIIFVLILHIIPLIIIFKKLTSFLDNIKLRKELLWNVILSFIGIIVITIHSLLYIFMDEKHQNVIQMHGYTIISVITSIIYFCICYIQTLFIILQPEAQIHFTYINHKYSVTSNSTPHSGHGDVDPGNVSPVSTPEIASAMSAHSKSPRSFHHTNASNVSVSGFKFNTQQNGKSSPYNTYSSTIRLNHVFKNDDTFKLFIRHLAKEYCIENALFLFESQQFKKQCNDIETQMMMMTRNSSSVIELESVNANKGRVSGSKSLSSVSGTTRRVGTYSKQRKNLLLSVPTTVPEQENESKNEDDDKPQTPQSDSDGKFDELLTKIEVVQETKEAKEEQTTALKLCSHHLATASNHYDGDNKILDYIPFHLIPQSQIIEKYQNDFEKIFVKLYDKYVDWKSSSFEINISGIHRSLLQSIYVRITYQLLMEERKQLVLDNNNNTSKLNKPRATQMWQSRKTIVNALKATITKKQMNEEDINNIKNDNVQNMERKVEIQEVVDALTLAEIDIVQNLNDSLSRFKKTPEFQNWVVENVNTFPATYK